MTQEEKLILLRDLSARLPYGVICNIWFKDSGEWKNEDMKLSGLFNGTSQMFFTSINGSAYSDEFKPYLRQMSNMDSEEIETYRAIIGSLLENSVTDNVPTLYNFLNSKHLDYNGLIFRGLALEAPEGMYDTKTK